MKTKGTADEALRTSSLDWVVLKPGLVIAPTAYGGTGMLRALAAFPWVQPLVLPHVRIQTVDVADLANAVTCALTDRSLNRQTFDLVEASPATLHDIVLKVRQWLGFKAPSLVVALPSWFADFVAKIADMTGYFGWRSPTRTTALTVLAAGILADAGPWQRATGQTLKSLDETLAHMQSTRQERSFARMELAFPLLAAVFALFWIVSGVIGIMQWDRAIAVVAPAIGGPAAQLAVAGGAIADIATGAALLFRKTFRTGCAAAIAVSIAYLAGGSIMTPHLWADPLGPLVKVLPVIGLAIALAAHAEER